MTSIDPQSGSPDYTKRIRLVSELQATSFLGTVILYCVFGYHLQIAKIVASYIANLYLQIALCWLPLGLVCIITSLPVSFYNFYRQRKFGLLKLGIGAWLRDLLKASLLGFLLYGAILEIVYSSHALSRSYDWISSGFLMAILMLAITRSFPWILSLFYPVVPLENQPLRERLLALANKAGMNAGTIFEWRISARTRQANAMVAGIGAARRILLTDTLIAELTEEEVEAMVAHEFGHCALHHVAKRLIFQFFWLQCRFLSHRFLCKTWDIFLCGRQQRLVRSILNPRNSFPVVSGARLRQLLSSFSFTEAGK